MTQIIPLLATNSQTLSVRLGGQPCRIHVYQKSTGLYLDLYVADVLTLGGVACRNGVGIVRDAYFGFVGDLLFADTQGSSDPEASGLGTRWVLAYVDGPA
jgi:hypothetical protein